MALRLAFRRLAAPLGIESGGGIKGGLRNTVDSVKGFKAGTFFEEKFFWEKANLGPFFLLLFFTPSLYRSAKDFYWTRQLRKLETEEIIGDRYEWLRLNMIKDEVEATLMKQAVPEPLLLGPASP